MMNPKIKQIQQFEIYGKIVTRSFHMLSSWAKNTSAYVFKWHKRFCEHQDDVEDKYHYKCPCTARTLLKTAK